jgi:hypothetical protein
MLSVDIMGALAAFLVRGDWTFPRLAMPSPGPPWSAGAGILVGAAADIKINYLLFAVGLAWALRRSAARLAVAACGVLGVLAAGYAWFVLSAVEAVLRRRNAISANDFYLHLVEYDRGALTHIGLIVLVLSVLFTALLLQRLPPGLADQPAIRPRWQYVQKGGDMKFLLITLIVHGTSAPATRSFPPT